MSLRTATSLRRLASAFGVTRLARLTGLDRCGVEVVGAVRPRGHVLQVSQGKGLTLEHAQWSALGEAIELSAAESPEAASFAFRPAPDDSPWDVGGLSVAWVEAARLVDREPCLVPAQSVYCPPAGTCWLGPSVVTWRSNGLGAHPTSRAAAEEHAVLELVERDALARALPHGWTPHEALRRLVTSPAGARSLGARGFACFLFDLGVAGGLPVAGSLLFDLEGGPVPLTAGYACRRSWAAAAEAAWLEAAQSRLTEIHGAREDVMLGEREDGAELLRALEGVTPRPPSRRVERRPLSKLVGGDVALAQLRASPFVVKAVSPTLLVSELL
ncbi:MAG: YcaO-like family protein [Archangium sp.]|nr:YcaO-like family protein [Archangium sp.]